MRLTPLAIGALTWLILVFVGVRTWVAQPPTGADRADAEAVMAYLRGVVDGQPGTPPTVLAPMALTVWVDGQRTLCTQGDATEMGAALADRVPRRARLQLDVVTALGHLPRNGLLHGLGQAEGRDGLLMGGGAVLVPPSDLVKAEVYGSLAPLAVAPELRLGVRPERTRALIAQRAGCLGVDVPTTGKLERARTLTLVEGADGQPRRLIGATTERELATPEDLRAAAVSAADYLVRGQRENGAFRYTHHPAADRPDKGYGWLRHAGVCYGLALAAHELDRPDFAESARRGIELLQTRLRPGPDGSMCLFEQGDCDVGDTAVALAAVSAYREATDSSQFDALADKLAAFVMALQKPDGFFEYDWSAEKGAFTRRMRAFEAQESAFSLAYYGRVYDDSAALDGAERALDHLSGPYWSHFTGQWVLGQEHWTCIAAAELGKARPKRSHAEFCHRVGTFYARLTLDPVDTPFAEDAGGIGLSQGMGVHMGATATVQEALVGARAVSRQHGLDTTHIDRAIALGANNLLGHQITAHDTFWITDPEAAIGGVYDARTRPWTRMDNVQHALTALLGAAE